MNPAPVNAFDAAEDALLAFSRIETATLRRWSALNLGVGPLADAAKSEIKATLGVKEKAAAILEEMTQ